MKHTPGPWEMDKDYKGRTVVNSNDDRICIVEGVHTVDIKHNARLIASAPEMYEALRRISLCNPVVRQGHVDFVSKARLVEMARAILAKVEPR